MTIADEHRTNPRVYFEEHIPRVLEERTQLREKFSGVTASASVEITGPEGGVWNINIDGSNITVSSGRNPNSTFNVELSFETFRQLRMKTLSPKNAFVRGKIKISGSVTTALKLAAMVKS
ncbi:MAG: SCP2 sterol-binding domain-containing protein [Myxococcota bacterium]|nr:SCP2 sterol-binding domain-containing protein [Myxococcota bacterium]